MTLTADLIARAIVASASVYGDHPLLWSRPATKTDRRAVAPAASAISRATGAKLEAVCAVLGLNWRSVESARSRLRGRFGPAENAAREALGCVMPTPKLNATAPGPVAIPERAPAPQPELKSAPICQPPPAPPAFVSVRDLLLAALPTLFAANPGGVLVGDIMRAANSCAYNTAVRLAVALADEGLARWVEREGRPGRKVLLPPLAAEPAPSARPPAARSPATSLQKVQTTPPPVTARAPSSVTNRQPAPKPIRPPAGRQIARGARFENLGDGVSVVRLKPIDDKIVARARQQLARGVSLADFADLFEVDAEALDRALKVGARA